jgi:hypothetical protein
MKPDEIARIQLYDHDVFVTSATRSERSRWYFIHYLSICRGYRLIVDPFRLAPSREVEQNYRDGGDIYIVHGDKQYRVEIKQRSFSFTTDPDSWRYDDVMVCAVHSWELADPKPYKYCMLSLCRHYAAIVMGSTRPYWIVRTKVRDRRYENHTQDKYHCPKEFVQFIKL